MKLYGMCKGRNFEANDLTDLKRKASIIANGYFDVCDELVVRANNEDGSGATLMYRRINKKCPNNTIERGVWK